MHFRDTYSCNLLKVILHFPVVVVEDRVPVLAEVVMVVVLLFYFLGTRWISRRKRTDGKN